MHDGFAFRVTGYVGGRELEMKNLIDSEALNNMSIQVDIKATRNPQLATRNP